MRILVICQYYSPEPFRLSDICEELAKRGHKVTVVTGLPNYPMGEIYEGYRHGKRRKEVINGVKVYRSFTIGRKHGVIYRFLNYYSYMLSSTRFVTKLKDKYDVVFVNQLSPVMMSQAALKYKKLHKTKVVLYCLDLWPESLSLGGVKQGSLLYKYYSRISKQIYKNVDSILVTSKSFVEHFEKQIGLTNVKYMPQYAESLFNQEECKKKPDEFVDLMFAGNLGVAQSVETILKAAKRNSDIQNLRWHIVGDGIELEQLKRKTSEMNLTNVFFYGRKPLEEMPRYYSMADAMLVTMQKNEIISLTLPGKVQTYMAAGKPIIGAIDGETKNVINEAACGLCVAAEDDINLAEVVRSFVIEKEFSRYACNSRRYYGKYFEKNKFIRELEEELLKYI